MPAPPIDPSTDTIEATSSLLLDTDTAAQMLGVTPAGFGARSRSDGSDSSSSAGGSGLIRRTFRRSSRSASSRRSGDDHGGCESAHSRQSIVFAGPDEGLLSRSPIGRSTEGAMDRRSTPTSASRQALGSPHRIVGDPGGRAMSTTDRHSSHGACEPSRTVDASGEASRNGPTNANSHVYSARNPRPGWVMTSGEPGWECLDYGVHDWCVTTRHRIYDRDLPETLSEYGVPPWERTAPSYISSVHCYRCGEHPETAAQLCPLNS